MTRALAAFALTTLFIPPASAQVRTLAYRGATLETIGPAGRIEGGTLVLRGGKIEAVGKDADVKIPDDARLIDARGKTILPGLVDPYFELATPAAEGETRTVRIGGRQVQVRNDGPTRPPTFVKVIDLFYPYEARFEPYLRSGLTHLQLVTRGYGHSAIVENVPDRPEALVIEPAGRLFLSVSNATATLDVLRNGLKSGKPVPTPGTDAKPASPEGEPKPAEPTGRGGGGGQAGQPSPAQPLWQAVVEGKSPLFIDAANAASILYVLEALKDYPDVQLVLLVSGPDVVRSVDALKSRPLTLVLRPAIDQAPDTRNRINASRFAHENGLKFAFSLAADRSALSASQDTPLFPLGYLVRTGLPRAAALEAVTLAPARLIGQDKDLGSLEAGKAATLLVFDGDPLNPSSRLREVLIDGSTVDEN